MINAKEFQNIIKILTSSLQGNGFFGYYTAILIAWTQPTTNKIEYALSEIYPYLSELALKGVGVSSKCRLNFDPDSFELNSNCKLHWNLPYLGKTEYADHVIE
jgi:hypothetical protein